MSLFSTSPPPSAPICCIVDRDGISRERLTGRCVSDGSVACVWLSSYGGCPGTSQDRDQLGGSGVVFTLVFCKTTFDQSIRYLSLWLLSRVQVWFDFFVPAKWCTFKSVTNLSLNAEK